MYWEYIPELQQLLTRIENESRIGFCLHVQEALGTGIDIDTCNWLIQAIKR